MKAWSFAILLYAHLGMAAPVGISGVSGLLCGQLFTSKDGKPSTVVPFYAQDGQVILWRTTTDQTQFVYYAGQYFPVVYKKYYREFVVDGVSFGSGPTKIEFVEGNERQIILKDYSSEDGDIRMVFSSRPSRGTPLYAERPCAAPKSSAKVVSGEGLEAWNSVSRSEKRRALQDQAYGYQKYGVSQSRKIDFERIRDPLLKATSAKIRKLLEPIVSQRLTQDANLSWTLGVFTAKSGEIVAWEVNLNQPGAHASILLDYDLTSLSFPSQMTKL